MTSKKSRYYGYQIDGNRVDEMIRNSGKTKYRLMNSLGLSEQALNQAIRKGSMTIPYIAKLCKYFDVEPESFVNEEVDDEMMWKWS